MLAVLVDENAHLNIARQLLDSMTPGFLQLGLWPPLIHIVIAPFAQIDFLWSSGLAGSIPSILFFSVTCVYIFKTVRFFSKDNLSALLSVVVFGFNPYVLYFSTVAMMEMLFFMNFIIAVHYFIKWIKSDCLFDVVVCAFFVTLACLTRFDGFILPIVFVVLILIRCLLLGKKCSQVESIIIIFGVLSCFGIFLILLYSIVFAGDPFAFISGGWSAYAQQHEGGYVLPAKDNLLYAFLYMLSAARYMVGIELGLISLVMFSVLIFRRSCLKIVLLFILMAPFVFNVLSLFNGNSVVYTPDFSQEVLNIRYGLSSVLFTSVAVGMFLIFDVRNRMMVFFKYFVGVSVVLVVVFFLIFSLIGNDGNNFILAQEVRGYPSEEMIQSAKTFNEQYDGGKLFVTRALNDFFIKNSELDIFNAIQESNDVYWEQTLEEPWLFARWILMFNPDSSMIWETKKDKISIKWANNDEIYKLYDVVLKNDTYIILKVNENAVIDYAKKNGLNTDKIPSINADIKYWNPQTIRDEIESKK